MVCVGQQARLGEAAAEPLRPFHRRIAALASLAFAGNGIDLGVVSFALPGMRAEWNLAPAELSLVLPAVGLGQCIGAVVFGVVADGIGRRLAFCATGVLAGVGTGLAGLATTPLLLSLALFIGGVGFGGVSPAAGSLVGEFAPPAYRGRMFAWTQVAWAIGWCVAAVGGGWFADRLGWRGTLGLGAFPVVTGLLALWLVPESPRFLLARGRRDEALALARRLSDDHGVEVPLVVSTRSPARGSIRSDLAELWGPAFRRRTFALWTAWAAMMAAMAGPVIWLPILLEDLGRSTALQVGVLVGFSMLPASLVAVAFIDRVGRRPLMLVSLGAAASGAAMVAVGEGPVPIVAGAMAVAGGTLAAWPVVLGWASELYPTRLRASASGWAAGVARLGNVAGSASVGLLLGPSGDGRLIAMLPFAALLVAGFVSVAVYGEETAGRSLEELSK